MAFKNLNFFEKMWEAYPEPGGTSTAAKALIGGNVDANWVTNTCVIRISRCFNAADHAVPRSFVGLNTISGGDGKRYAFRVKEFRRYLNAIYGPPQLSHTYQGGAGGPVPEAFKGAQGVICFVVDGWTDATGHVDLWHEGQCRHKGYFDRAQSVYLWRTPDGDTRCMDGVCAVAPALGGSVGIGAANAPADVLAVQRLLLARGVSPGVLDGQCGPRTTDAIEEFQGRFFTQPDGRVDPEGRTWRELNGL